MVHPCLLVGALFATTVASADPCAMVVALEGDPTAVAAIGEQLVARGISIDTSACPGTHTRVERRRDQFVIVLAGTDGVPIERVVSDAGTAATVIESFVRVDVGTPLLASRTAPSPPAITTAPPSPRPARERTGAHLFGSFDSAVASDRTNWIGMQIGACVMLGHICPSARFRFDIVVGPSNTLDDATFRNSSELLVGIDLPLAARSWLLMPGIAVGMGGIRTDREPAGEPRVKRETTGLRGEIHGTVLVPITHKLSVDLTIAAVLLQETEIDEGAMTPLPRDPWMLFRFGVGLRYGSR